MPAPGIQDDRTREDVMNPSNQNYEDRFNDVQSSVKDAETAANKSDKEQISQDSSVGNREENPSNTPADTIKNNFTGEKQSTAVPWGKKKKGALTGIIIFLLGIMGVGTTLFTPGLGIVQMKEVLTGNLNDQLAAMDIRSNSVFKAKLSSMSSGVCTGVQIKCKFKSMSKKQVERFKKAGFVIPENGVKDGLLGRKIITSMTAPDGTEIRNPADLTKARNSSMQVRSAMNRVFNPTYYGLADKVANTFFANNKTNKQKKVTGETDDDRKKSITDATSGEKANGGGVLKDSTGRNYMVDSDGTRAYEDDPDSRFNQLKQEAEANNAKLGEKEKVGGKATSSVLSVAGGAIKGLSVIGAADSACTVYNTARAVSAAAKIARSMQLIQFAMVINSTADSIKAGEATPEEVETVGVMLTTTDTRKTITDETTDQVIDNPFYGMGAFDSPGFKTAAYNEAPTLTPRSQQYMVGGGLTGTLSTVLSEAERIIGGGDPENVRKTCGFVQSPWIRGAGLIAGVFLAVGSLGFGTAVSVAASVAVSFALPFLEASLADIAAGTVVSGDTTGVDAGDAVFAGTSAMFGGIAMNRGMTPMSSEGLKAYQTATMQSTSDAIALQKYEAAKTPFDVMNQYSFLGSFARSLYPTTLTAKTSVSGAISSIGSILTQGFSSVIKPVSAAQVYNEARYTKCNDPGYEELGINADVFCNVRYGLTPTELAMDTEAVVDLMLEKGYISNAGVPQKEYAEFMKNCVNRTDGWGETSEENGDIGLKCIDGRADTYPNISYFRVYTMDSTISDAMDDEEEAAPAASSGEFVLPVDPGYSISSPWGPRSCSGCSTFHRGIDMTNYPGGSKGKPVYSIADGTVVMADKSNGSGTSCAGGRAGGGNNLVKVQHANGTVSGYWHMAPGDILVSEGDTVTAGQRIGAINNCGQSYGAHLHFTIWPGDTTDPNILAIEGNGGYLNPKPFMALFGVDTDSGTYTDGR